MFLALLHPQAFIELALMLLMLACLVCTYAFRIYGTTRVVVCVLAALWSVIFLVDGAGAVKGYDPNLYLISVMFAFLGLATSAWVALQHRRKIA